jgi:GT2 family glycosyltransferase
MHALEGGGGPSFPSGFLAALRRRLQVRHRPERRISKAYAKWLKAEPHGPVALEGPRISVLLPVYNPPAQFLKAAIQSVRKQSYRNWELCIVDDASPAPSVALLIADLAAQDGRISRVRLANNVGVAAATNAALAMATGEFVALLDHDDALPSCALARVAAELVAHPDTDVLFSDEDKLVRGQRCSPYFKPGWNPDLMLSQNLVSHLGVYRRSLIEGLGGLRSAFTGSQDYDLALRATAQVPAARIRHVPEVLYHWRQHDGSFSVRRAAQCAAASRAALAARLGGAGAVEANPDVPQWTRIIYRVPSPPPLVTLVLPPGTPPPAEGGYEAIEICAGDLRAAAGEVVVFLGRAMQPGRPGWLRELVSHALRPEIGCAGPRLDGPDGRIVQAGLALHPREIAQTLSPPSDEGDLGYFGHFALCRTVSAVAQTGLTIRRALFDELGGFDPAAGAYADVDLCLRLAARHLRCVWTPHARLRYAEPPRRRSDEAGLRAMQQRWGDALARDPYANRNLVIRDGALVIKEK